MDRKLLTSLGFAGKEVQAYEAILRLRQATPSQLAKEMGIKRTTVYSTVRNLIDRGLIVEDTTRRPRVFIPAGPDSIHNSIDLEKKRSEERQVMLAELAELISQQQIDERYPIPRITFIEESGIEVFLDKRGQTWSESMLKLNEKTFWGFQDPTFLEYFDGWIERYWKKAPRELDVKLITNLSRTERKATEKYERRQAKYWGEATNFTTTTWVLGEYLIMINTRQKPFYLVEIHSAALAHNQREVFRNLWEMI